MCTYSVVQCVRLDFFFFFFSPGKFIFAFTRMPAAVVGSMLRDWMLLRSFFLVLLSREIFEAWGELGWAKWYALGGKIC